ncbi:DUF2799 domain-containing protein [Vibrio sp. PP-XX7]
MKKLCVVLLLTGLAGCSAQSYPTASSQEDWKEYGHLQGLQGVVKASMTDIEQSGQGIDEPLYSMYTQGYEQGIKVYCEQDAYKLGQMQRPYHGVCDGLKPEFRSAYKQGQWDDDFSTGANMSESDYD